MCLRATLSVHVCVCVCVHARVYVCACVCVCVCVEVCMCACMCACMHVCVHACGHVCLSVCLCVVICVQGSVTHSCLWSCALVLCVNGSDRNVRQGRTNHKCPIQSTTMEVMLMCGILAVVSQVTRQACGCPSAVLELALVAWLTQTSPRLGAVSTCQRPQHSISKQAAVLLLLAYLLHFTIIAVPSISQC